MYSTDRKAELGRKKARLEQIRADKKRRDEERRRIEARVAQEAVSSGPAGGQSSETDLERRRREAEYMLRDFGIAGESGVPLSPSRSGTDGGSPAHSAASVGSPQRSAPPIQLALSKVSQVNIPPKEQVFYSKETQTPVETQNDQDDEDDIVPMPMSPTIQKPKFVSPTDDPTWDKKQEDDKKERQKELSDEEKKTILNSDDFLTFLTKSGRFIERAICEQDVAFDYIGNAAEKEGEGMMGDQLSLNRQFSDDRWSRHRTVTSLDWSVHYPELLVASYNNNEESPHEPDGVALVWNTKYKAIGPEFIFHCQSSVMSAVFAKFHPNLIIGGTYSGQIVLWDNRSNKRTPMQRTPLSASAHTHPVYSVSVVGTQNAHNLISISSDGKMCSWNLDMMSQPQDSMELHTSKQTRPIAVTCASFPANDVNNFVVGSEEGSVCTACRHGSKAGIAEIFDAHSGPVTGIDFHKTPGHLDFSHLFLSSSFDWTLKLWTTKSTKPLHSFEDNSDYVCGVQWSPIHPAVFASVDGIGRIDLWNLNYDIEVPATSLILDPMPAINKLCWNGSGHQIAVGDSDGRVWVMDVGDHLANPRTDDWAHLAHTLQDIETTSSEAEEDKTNTGFTLSKQI